MDSSASLRAPKGSRSTTPLQVQLAILRLHVTSRFHGLVPFTDPNRNEESGTLGMGTRSE
jgi:hypothetical protein